MNNVFILTTILLILILIIYYNDIIRVTVLNILVILRGILVPKCFWFNISDKLLKDSSGVELFYKFRKQYGKVPQTYMFGEKIYIITEENHIKYILDNSPNIFGPGKLKIKFFKSFMKDNVGVSSGCPWKRRRILNEAVFILSPR